MIDNSPPLLQIPAQQLRYTFVSVHRVVGFSTLPEGVPETIQLKVKGTSAFLISNPNSELRPIDEHGAIAELLLRAVFRAEVVESELRSAIDVRINACIDARMKVHNVPGVFLVVRAEEDIETEPCNGRDVGFGVLAIEAVDKKALAARHEALVSAIVAATSLAVGHTSAELLKVAAGVYLKMADGRPMYSFTFNGGNVGLQIARVVGADDAEKISVLANKLIGESTFTTPTHLLADAVCRSTDRLEAFILAWAALEMIVKKSTMGCESGSWITRVTEVYRDAAKVIHGKHLQDGHKHYGLADRVRAFGMMKGITDFEALASQINSIKTIHREPLFHEGKLDDRSLPVEAVISLVRRLLDTAVTDPV